MDISASVNRGSATCEMFPDSCVTELNKDLEKAKVAYESESQRIKAEYDKEAEILHKRYEALLIEQHRSYTKRQHQVQQNIMKVEWNRQLVEALKLREELAARAAIFAGLSSQTSVQPVANQQAPPQIPGRPQSGGTAAAPVPVNTSRVTMNAGNASPGIASVIMQPPGTSSTRVSTAPVQHPPRYGVPAAPQQESPRYATPAAPQQEPPRYGMHTAPRNEQPRSSMSEAMAVLAASGNAAGTPGSNASAGSLQAQLASVFTPSPEPVNSDAGAGSPRPRTSGLSVPVVVAPVSSPPPFQDPILAIIRNSVPSLDPVVIPQEDPVVVPPVSFVAIPPMTPVVIPAVGMGSFPNPQSCGPANPLPAGVESHIARSAEATLDHQIESGAQSDMLDITIEGVDVRLGTVHLSSGLQEQPIANVAVSRPPSLIYLSDSDDE